jgi:hypothetical protein
MARGWESKSVEGQIESANEARGIHRVRLSPAELETERKKDSLLLSRTRVIRDLEKCENPQYRKTLEEGLAYLEAQLIDLGWTKQ